MTEPEEETLDLTDWTDDPIGDKFALRVTGDSMIDEHIADGDYVVIKKQDQAKDGQIVAFRDDEGQAVLRRYRKGYPYVRLEAANKDFGTIYRRPENIAILGVLVGVVRRY